MSVEDSGIVEHGPVRPARRIGSGAAGGRDLVTGRDVANGRRRPIRLAALHVAPGPPVPPAPRGPSAPAIRRVLFAAPTMATAERLLDIAGLFAEDQRIQPVFTVPPNVLGRGTRPMLAARGIAPLAWTQALGEGFDLAVTADVDSIAAFGDTVPVAFFSPGDPHAAAGLCGRVSIPLPGPVIGFTRSELLRAGRLVPAALALAHEQELRLVRERCPDAAGVAAVVGDPCYDRIASSAAHRVFYRAALGLRARQKLVVVTSSWRADSLFGSGRPVMERLLGELPAAEYRAVLLTQPEAWAAYGDEQMAAWFRRWERLGLATVGPREDWRPYLAAADFIVGDSEAVGLYGAAAGVPVLLGAFGDGAGPTDPTTPPSPSQRSWSPPANVPRLSADRPIISQLAYAAVRFDPAAASESAARAGAGGFARRTRQLLYSLLGLSQPPTVAELPPAPRPSALDTLRPATLGLGRAA
ncbi:MAG TPA: hypothetical protein VGX23_11860 [Actinocrinis sp.]|nr:hypothetical protein [Actinocrinis sp.]